MRAPFTIPGMAARAPKPRKAGSPASLGLLMAICMLLLNVQSNAQGTWTAVSAWAPHYNDGVMLLLSDGTVLCKNTSGGSTGLGTGWDKLTPNANGSYINGTWSSIAPMADERLYFSSQILKDGRVYVAGGEYGSGGNKGEIYNPQTNTWTALPPVRPGPYSIHISDANSEILPDGKVLQAVVDTANCRLNYVYNPVNNTYSAGATCLRRNNEASWLKLPDQSILFVDNYGTTSERYIPSTGTWVNDGIVPLSLYDAYGFEAGAAFLLPNGKGFFIGATNHTAFYTPSGTTSPGTWTAGPDIPGTQGAPDAAAAMMVNGKIIMAVSPVPTSADHFPPPAKFYEFDYTNNTFTELAAPWGGSSLTGVPAYYTNMLCLPDGTILYATQGDNEYFVYTPSGSPLTAGKPTINSIIQTGTTTFKVTGTLFNGISEGAGYGDDWQMATNYPIVRITSGSNVYYARTYNWNSTDVMRGSALDTTEFTIPAGVTSSGSYTLQVIANGNASTPQAFVPGVAAIAPSNPVVCAGRTITLTDATSGGTWSSSTPAIATVGSTGIVTGLTAGTARISYTNGISTATVVLSVNASPSAISVVGGATLCANDTYTLTATPSGGTWASGNASSVINATTGVVGIIYGGVNITYTAGNGCTSTLITDVNVAPSIYSVTGGGAYCTGGTGVAVGLSNSGASISYGITYHYSLYRDGTLVTSTSTAGGSPLSFGLQTTPGVYTIIGSGNASACPRNMTGSATVSTTSTIPPITGNLTLCAGSTTTLGNATSGGTWSSANMGVAIIGSTGIVTGISTGTATISYIASGGCSAATVVTVTAGASPITGSTAICVGNTTALSDATTGGSWSSSNAAVASVNTATGIVSALTAGTATISYAISGCTITTVITVSAIPTAYNMTGGGSYCAGGTGVVVGLSGSATGVQYQLMINGLPTGSLVTGTGSALSFGVQSAAGVYTATGTNTAAACITNMSGSVSVSITGAASAITGPTTLCSGSSATLSDSTSGGTWSSSNTSVATVGAATGLINSLSPGTAIISYTLGGSCTVTTTLQVLAMPAAYSVIGGGSYCMGGSGVAIGLSGSSIGTNYQLFAGSAAIGSPVSGTGSGINFGMQTIAGTYTVQAINATTGCTRIMVGSATVVANPLPAAISGLSSLVAGGTTTLSDATSGGTWSSSNTSIASINSATGVVNGVNQGAATITYTLPTGCNTTFALTITSSLTGISGDMNVCVGSTSALSNSTAGGSWSSDNNLIATIGAGTGIVSGIAAGTVNITYTLSGSTAIAVVTVNPLPPVVTGAASVCVNATTTLSNGVASGSWSSAAAGIAGIDAATGVATGVAAGSVTITYTLPTGCYRTYSFTVKPLPAAIAGNTTLCEGGTSILSNSTGVGVSWTSDNTSVATINSGSGLLTGIAQGTANITYTINTGCNIATTVTVNSLPGTITGSAVICAGTTTTLSGGDSSGVWSSSNNTVATVNAAGVVTGMSAGMTTIAYVNAVGCARSMIVTVNAGASAITGTTTVCAGSTAMLSASPAGGSWSSSDPSIATISPAGLLTGIVAGAANINYTSSTGCASSITVTISSALPAISGLASTCVGMTTALGDSTIGGTWSSSNNSVATVSATAVVSGVAVGTATITYTVGAGCRVTTIITVAATLPAITGSTVVCAGATATLVNAVAGGVWSTSNTAVATADAATGDITGVSAGTVIITYSVGSCYKTTVFTVRPLPAAITGNTGLCIGTTTVLADASTIGLSWTSSTPAVATINSSGIVTGIATGTSVITYTLNTGCAITTVVTVGTLPAAITGVGPVCPGSSITLASADAGGTWSSGNNAVATADLTTGAVTGVAAGVVNITYNLLGCKRTATVTVSALPGAITGVTSICTGSSVTLTDATTGGAWSSSDPSTASVSSTGLVSGNTAGAATISYSIGAGCVRTTTVTVAAMTAITGNLNACVGITTALANATPGGTWSSSSTAIASVNAAGVVTGIAMGNATITYAVTPGCRVTAAVTVNRVPAAITGTASVCAGSSTTLSDTTAGGVWSSSNIALASVSGGVVTGVAAGTPVISYTLGTGCYRTISVIVKAVPVPIAGNRSICVGSTSVVTDATPTGVSWTSSTPAVATIGAGSGLLTGISVGTTLITYLANSGCTATAVVTVSPALTAGVITGPSSVSVAASIGTPVLYTSTATGGTWTSSNTARATIGASTGLLTGVSAGALTVSYTVTSSCGTARTTQLVTMTTPRAAGSVAAENNAVQLYPNPTSGIFTLQASVAGQLVIYSVEGKELATYETSAGTTTLSLPKGLAAGTYMCSYTGNDGSTAVVRLVYQP